MAALQDFSFRKVLLFYFLLFVFTCVSVLVCGYTETQPLSNEILSRRGVFEDEPIKKKSTSTTPPINNNTLLSTKNKTKLTKPTNSTKLIKTTTITTDSTKNKTKLIKPTTITRDSIDEQTPNLKMIKLKKINSTSKSSNSTKRTSLLSNKSSDLTKPSSPKNKTTKPTQTQLDKKPKTQKKSTQPSWVDQEDEDNLISEFRDLPSKFQETLLPDLERISTTSKVYLNKANKEITKGFKPIVGKKYAPTIASLVSCAFILIPLILVSLIFNRIKAYFSLQKLLIFIQVYLSIYFSILCLSSLVTGLEPLKYFYATSQSTYVCLQLLQTLGYVVYLLVLLMYLVLVFSTQYGIGSKLLGLGQTFVGFSVGLHYYMTVFHRAVLQQPPKTSWRVHAIYATCFLLISLLATAERRKKAYLVDGGEEGKKK